MQISQQVQRGFAVGQITPVVRLTDCSQACQPRRKQNVQTFAAESRPLAARSASVICRASRTGSAVRAVAAAEDTWKLTLQTDEAKVSMRFGEIMDGPRNKIIVISDVAQGSEAEKKGLKPGQRIVEISDPINTNEMLDMRKNASRQGALRALANRVPQQVFMTLTKNVPSAAQKLIDECGGDYRSALEAQATKTGSNVNVSPERLADRQAFMDTPPDSGRQTFAAVAFILLFVLPAIFLVVAIQSGYLQRIGGDYGF